MRSITITPRIQDMIRAHLGGDLPSSDQISVFEATAYSTRPLSKRGSIFHKGVASRTALTEMAAFLNKGTQVPLQVMHSTGGKDDLPIGRLFHAEVHDVQEASELRVLFYLPNSEAKLVNNIETAIIQAVSVGVLHEHLLCSECGWDYRGEEANFLNFWDQTCGNGHVIGENGVHLNLTGLENWYELSLVDRGADRSANIVSRAKARLSETQIEKLAASGTPFEGLMLVATHKEQGDPAVDLKALVDRLEAQSAELTTSKASVTTLTATVDDLTKQLADAKAKLEAAEKGENPLTAELAETKTKLTAAEEAQVAADKIVAAALTFLQEQTKKALVASGQTDPAAPATVDECIAKLTEAKTNLVNLLAAAGGSLPADQGADGVKAPMATNAFKTRK